MQIIHFSQFKKLVPSDPKNVLILKADLKKPMEDRYYFDYACIPHFTTLSECQELYSEISLKHSQDSISDK